MRTAARRSGSVLRTKPRMLVRNGLWNVRQVCIVLLRLAPFGASDRWRLGSFGGSLRRISVVNERRAVRRCAVRPSAEDPLLLDMTIARRRQGFGFANGVGRLLSVGQAAPSYGDRRFGWRISLSDRIGSFPSRTWAKNGAPRASLRKPRRRGIFDTFYSGDRFLNGAA